MWVRRALTRFPDPFRFRLLLLLGFRRLLGLRPSGAYDLVGCAENLLGAFLWNCVGVRTCSLSEPILYVTPAIRGSVQAQRFATEKRNRFGFYFAQASRCCFAVGEIAFCRVAQHHVAGFVKERLVWQLRNRIDRDLSFSSEPLTVAVRAVKVDPFNIESRERLLCVPLRNWGCCEFLAFGLADDKPARTMDKGRVAVFSVCLVVAVCFLVSAFASDRHA